MSKLSLNKFLLTALLSQRLQAAAARVSPIRQRFSHFLLVAAVVVDAAVVVAPLLPKKN